MKKKIYLIPGFMTDERLWDRLRPLLEDKYELIHTPIPLTPDFDKMVEEVDKHFPNEKLNLLGFSLGGYLASYYTIKNPNRVERLFLVAATPSATACSDVKRREAKIEKIKKDNHITLSVEKTKELLEFNEDENLVSVMKDMFDEMGVEYFVPHLLSTLKRVNLHPQLNELNTKISMFYSKDDRLLNHEAMKEMLTDSYRFEISSREGTSHAIPLEDPKQLSQKIIDWLE